MLFRVIIKILISEVNQMQLDIYKEPLQYEANASEKKLDAFKQFHTKYASDWIRLDYLSEAFIADVKTQAEHIRKDFDALVVIGIGGSYIGAKAFIDALGSDFPIYFTGNMLDSGCITKLLHELQDKRYAINVISKSGTTMETKLVFEIFLEDMKKKGIDFANGVIVTSSNTSELANFAAVHKIKTFSIPEDIGGRYSVFTAVGLLPMAVAGLDIDALVLGIKNAKEEYFDNDGENNMALDYAYYRHLAGDAYALEFISVYEERLASFTEWIKQLLCESLAKDGKGLIVSNLKYTQDLHSMGQLLQEGRRNIIETHIFAGAKEAHDKAMMNLNKINEIAFKATVKAHHMGGVPTCAIRLKSIDEESLAKLAIFYMAACVYNAAMDMVEPYGQPGVEVYKEKIRNILEE